MITVGDIYDALDLFCPFEQQETWDNSGLLVGNRGLRVNKIAVSLDITVDTVEQAHTAGADLIVSHHPVIFNPLKNIEPDNPVYLLAKYGISAICAHTCLDCAIGGVNDVLAIRIGLSNVKPIQSPHAQTPLLRVGELEKAMMPRDFAKLVCEKLDCRVLFVDGGAEIKRVAICGGSGGEFYEDAETVDCQALVTGEAKYHEQLGAAEKGITLIAAGHFETENPVVETLYSYLSEKFNGVEIVILNQNSPAEII